MQNSIYSNRMATMVSLLLWFLATCLLLVNLGQGSLLSWDESLTAMRSWNMFTHGFSFTVVTDTSPDFNKPPLYYWLASAFFHLFGPNLFTLRLPSVLFGLGCLWCVYQLTYKLTGSRWAAIFGFGSLVFNGHWMNMARLGMLETAIAWSVLAALLWGGYSQYRNTIGGAVVTGLLLCVGAWIKYPATFILLIPLYLHWKYIDRFTHPARLLWVSLCTFVIVGFGWYYIQYLQWGEAFINFFFTYNMFNRVTTGIEGHEGSTFLYIELMLRYAPVTFILFCSAVYAVMHKQRGLHNKANLIVFTTLIIFIGLCCMASKRRLYIRQWYPLASVCAGYGAFWLYSYGITSLPSQWRNKLFAAMGAQQATSGWKACVIPLCILAYCFSGLFSSYKFVPSYSATLTDVCREVKKRGIAKELVYAVVESSATVNFELGRVLPRIDDSALGLQTVYDRVSAGHTAYIITERVKKSGIETRTGVEQILEQPAAIPKYVAVTKEIIADRVTVYKLQPQAGQHQLTQ